MIYVIKKILKIWNTFGTIFYEWHLIILFNFTSNLENWVLGLKTQSEPKKYSEIDILAILILIWMRLLELYFWDPFLNFIQIRNKIELRTIIPRYIKSTYFKKYVNYVLYEIYTTMKIFWIFYLKYFFVNNNLKVYIETCVLNSILKVLSIVYL